MKRFSFWFKLGLSVALLVILLLRVDLRVFGIVFEHMNIGWLIAGYGALWCTLLLHTWRWQWLLKADGVRISYPSLFGHYLIGYFFGHFLPRIVGGDLVRALSVSKLSQSKIRSITIITLGRVVGIMNLLIILIVCVLTQREKAELFSVPIRATVGWAVFILIGLVSAFLILTSNRVRQLSVRFNGPMTQVLDSLSIYREKWIYLIITFLISSLLEVIVLFRHYFVAQALGLEIDFASLGVAAILVMGVTMLPITFNGVGLREYGFVYLLSFFSIAPEQAFLFSVTNYALMVLMAGAGGLFYLWRLKKESQEHLGVLSIGHLKQEAGTP